MKVPPKRKGNRVECDAWAVRDPLNESPSEKEGKCSNSPASPWVQHEPSMKVPPKRKGNIRRVQNVLDAGGALNESPSEKEGKSHQSEVVRDFFCAPSMKVPPKRKGNCTRANGADIS